MTIAVILAVALACLWLARRRFLLVTVDGLSMTPALRDGDRVLVQRTTVERLTRGTVVIVQRPADSGSWEGARDRWIVKRVHSLPGDPIPVHLGPALAGLRGAVPPGFLVVLGDSPEGSFDSRYIGLVPAERLLGVVRWCVPGQR